MFFLFILLRNNTGIIQNNENVLGVIYELKYNDVHVLFIKKYDD